MEKVHKRIRLFMYLFCFIIIGTNFYPYTIIDPELAPYQKEFIETVSSICPAYKYLHPLQTAIYFDQLEKTKIAYSLTNNWTRVRFVFDREHWEHATNDARFATCMHEFSHGYLGMDHSEDPDQYMFAYENHLPREIVQKQLIEVLKERCQ